MDLIAILSALVVGALALFFGGKRSQRIKHKTEERNRGIATGKRIQDAKADLPSTADDARQRLRDRAGR